MHSDVIRSSGFSVPEPPSLLLARCEGRGKSRSIDIWIWISTGVEGGVERV